MKDGKSTMWSSMIETEHVSVLPLHADTTVSPFVAVALPPLPFSTTLPIQSLRMNTHSVAKNEQLHLIQVAVDVLY